MDDIIVSRGHRYNRTTGRWLGPVTTNEEPDPALDGITTVDGLPVASEMTVAELRQLAKDNELMGFSKAPREVVTEALYSNGLVSISRPEEITGEEE